jgi:hypothetical protein
MQSVPITTDVMNLNLDQGEVHNIKFFSGLPPGRLPFPQRRIMKIHGSKINLLKSPIVIIHLNDLVVYC